MTTTQAPKRRGGVRPLFVVVPVILFVIVFVLARSGAGWFGGSTQDRNLFLDRPPLVSTDTAVARAASSTSGPDQQILQRLADVPQATWLTPEAYPIDQVGGYVAKIAAEGEQSGRTPVFVVYGIPDRDCSGGFSGGGLPAGEYEQWVDRIAGAAGKDSAVILEPDALATATECQQVDQRTKLLRTAVDELVSQGPVVYLDAGHANWITPSDMATLLRASGVDQARGFSTNVAAYQSDADETAFADAVSAELDDAHYVIDTSRNGVGSTNEWCNPADRAVGREPAASGQGGLDAYLWIKPPGESDGTCGGGPEAGQFWTERAVSLAKAAGW